MKEYDIPRSQLEVLIDEWILDDRYKAITKRRLLDNVKYETLAEEAGMSDRQIKNIVKKCSTILSGHL